MPTLYRRHSRKCKHFAAGQGYTKCRCPIWAYGVLNGRTIRRSTCTRDWEVAAEQVAEWKLTPPTTAPAITVGEAVSRFLEDCRIRNLRPSTLVYYRQVLGELPASRQVDAVVPADLQPRQDIAPSTRRKFIRVIRALFNYLTEQNVLERSPARAIRLPIVDQAPTLPFSREEIQAIRAVPMVPDTRALILVMLYSGLRISDAIALSRKDVVMETGRLRLYAQKTRRPVYVKLHPDAISALTEVVSDGGPYFFRQSSAGTATYRKRLMQVFKAAGVVDGHPHRFRDTFAVELLLAGVDIRTVQLLLGHSSLLTTERHYAPWVQAMQGRLDEATARLQFPVAQS